MSFKMLDENMKVEKPEEEIFRATYRRRGSEIYIAATTTSKVQVTRFKTRANSYEYWHYDPDVVEQNASAVKEWLETEKYSKVSAMPIEAQVPSESAH